MSRSTFQTTSYDVNETPSLTSVTNSNPDHTRSLRLHHRLMPTISTSSRSNESLPVVVVQSTTTTLTDSTQRKSVVHLNPKVKRNLRGKRRATGIRPDEVSLASAINDVTLNEDDDTEDLPNTSSQFITITANESSESFEPNRTSPPKPMFKVSRIQPTFDDKSHHPFDTISVTRTDSYLKPSPLVSSSNVYSTNSTKLFRPEEFILRRQGSEEDSSSAASNRRHIQDRVRLLESLVSDKDSLIQELQRKLEQTTRDLNEAQQQVYILQRDKLTLIKTLATLQDPKVPPSNATGGELSAKRTGYITRN